MKEVKITYWQDGKWWLGYLNDYPEYETQGESFDELKANIIDILKDINEEKIDGLRKIAILELE